MAILFKPVERGEPGVAGGGKRKYYASPVMNGVITLEDFTKSIEKRSTVNGADIRAVLYAMVDVAIEHLADGALVRLGDLGSIRINLRTTGKDTPEAVDASSINKAVLTYTPGRRLKEMLSNVKYKKK